METVFLVIHLILALAIIGLVLIQKSEGGGLGIGGGTGGGMTTAASAKNILSRTTAICAASFFATSLILGILAGTHSKEASLIDKVSTELSRSAEDIDTPSIEIDTEETQDAVPSIPISE